MTTTLTDEQKEQIRKNREKALELQKKKKRTQQTLVGNEEKKEWNEGDNTNDNNHNNNNNHNTKKKQKITPQQQHTPQPQQQQQQQRTSSSTEEKAEKEKEDDVMEDWEIEASLYVTKKEAQSMYCLPEGTLAVCTCIEKENPRHKGFKPMKLYERKEIRQRAHRRYGGIQGLQQERKQREENRFRKDLERTKNIFRN
mmetsp:Transcript_10212/g.11263  ORF Transcript_10212/g.11263 Transcript_10212/m.11263 type:complete len:198 (-) Transcript_10212:35-628(-)